MESDSFNSVQPTVCSYSVLIFNAIQDEPLPGILRDICDGVKLITLLSVSGGVAAYKTADHIGILMWIRTTHYFSVASNYDFMDDVGHPIYDWRLIGSTI